MNYIIFVYSNYDAHMNYINTCEFGNYNAHVTSGDAYWTIEYAGA